MKTTVISTLALLLLSGVLWAADGTQDVPSFSNKDLQKYESPTDVKEDTEPQRSGERYQKRNYEYEKKTDSSKESWCKRGTRARKRIERAKDRIREIEQNLAEKEEVLWKTGKPVRKDSGKSLRKAKRNLKEAEDELAELENEARRKWIPPGWLRCQFE